jgi:hypothetical protein
MCFDGQFSLLWKEDREHDSMCKVLLTAGEASAFITPYQRQVEYLHVEYV